MNIYWRYLRDDVHFLLFVFVSSQRVVVVGEQEDPLVIHRLLAANRYETVQRQKRASGNQMSMLLLTQSITHSTCGVVIAHQ